MNRHIYRPSRAPNRSAQRPWSDNIVLAPASQLPFKDEWKRVADRLPAGDALLIVPKAESPLKQVARALVPEFRARGRHVTAEVV